MLNQNRYKFTSRPSSLSNQSQQTSNRTNYPQQNYNQNRNQFKEAPKITLPDIIIDDKNDDDDDDDLLDISDTELIRASQAVESQLKFTNNIHQTTSNAITIFSQITSNSQQQQPMPPPPPIPLSHTTTTSYSSLNNYDSIDDIKCEIKQLKNENMQKDGEVKILRDKLKRLEQETQKMRNEKFDLVKKLQQQHEDAKKSLQKHMEFKDLENQFKSQELMEITMKYKCLQSSILKNSNNQQQQQQQSVLSSTPSNQKIQQPKSLPTKRAAAQTTHMNSSDTENDNPTDIKRPRQQQQQTPKINPPLKTRIFKRGHVLNTKSFNITTTPPPSDLIYKLTDRLSETSNLLCQINQGKTSVNSLDFQHKLLDLNSLLKRGFNCQLVKVTNTDRIEYISDKLNGELVKLLKNNLDLLALLHIDLNQIDLNCCLIQTLFRLFLIRFDLLIDSNSTLTHGDLNKLANKLKQQFFLVLSQCLESLNFTNINKLIVIDDKNQSLLAYWSLKIFINIFDIVNYLSYLPLSSHVKKSHKTKHLFYVSLVDNLHSIFKNLSLVGDESTNCSSNNNNGHVDDGEEEDTCLLHLFYDKLSKFFSEVLYLLETSENRKKSVDEPVSKELEIITTIVDESKNSKIDFKLENRISENYLMNNSLSECDNDIFQSQVDPVSSGVSKPEPLVLTHNSIITRPSAEIQQQQQQQQQQQPINFNADLSQLKLECFTKFAYLIHNYQLMNSTLEIKFKAQDNQNEVLTEESSCKKRKIYKSMSNLSQIGTHTTHSESCGCFKEMLNSYLCLIDYQFGDKLNTLEKTSSSMDLNNNNSNLDLLLMLAFNSYVTVSNTHRHSKRIMVDSESMKRKLSALDTMGEDYRLKNFFSLFSLLFDRALVDKHDVDRMQIDDDLNNPIVRSHHHLNNSFSSLRLYFKSYVDDYFDFTQN